MARLPVPGQDMGEWGDILNDFLSQSLNDDGTVKQHAVEESSISPGAVSTDKIADDAVTSTKLAPGIRTKIDATASDLSDLNSVVEALPVVGGVHFSVSGFNDNQFVLAGSFQTYPLDLVEVNLGGGTWNPDHFTYTIPATGLYACNGGVRLEDGQTARSVGVGIGASNADGSFVLWGEMGGMASGRSGRHYSRLARFNAGDQVRLFIYSDAVFPTKSQRHGSFLTLIKLAD